MAAAHSAPKQLSNSAWARSQPGLPTATRLRPPSVIDTISDAPIRFADCDSDQLVTLQRPKIVSDGRAIHGHELGEFTSP
jgi:hypothetical protein